MLTRVGGIVTVLFLLINCNSVFPEKSEKCDYCKHFVKTGLSPYEILWTLREEIGREVPSQLLEKKMMFRIDDIKLAEGSFLEFCKQNCYGRLDGKKGEKVAKTLTKKGKILHFLSQEEVDRFTKLAKKEFKKMRKKFPQPVRVTQKKTIATPKRITQKTTSDYDFDEMDKKYIKLYQNVLFGNDMGFLGRFAGRSLQNPQNTGNDTTLQPDSIPTLPSATTPTTVSEITESTTQTTTDPNEESTTVGPEVSTVTEGSTTVPSTIQETTTESVGEMTEESEMDESDYEEESTEDYSSTEDSEKETTESKISGRPTEKPTEKPEEEEFFDFLEDLMDLTSDDTIKLTIKMTSDFVNCIMDLIFSEIEEALGLRPGLIKREPCGGNDKTNTSGFNMAGFLEAITGKMLRRNKGHMGGLNDLLSPEGGFNDLMSENDIEDLLSPEESFDDVIESGGDTRRFDKDLDPPKEQEYEDYTPEYYSYYLPALYRTPTSVVEMTGGRVDPPPPPTGSVKAFKNYLLWEKMHAMEEDSSPFTFLEYDK